MWGHSEKRAIYEAGSISSSDNEPAGTLIPVFRNVRKQLSVVSKPPSLWHCYSSLNGLRRFPIPALASPHSSIFFFTFSTFLVLEILLHENSGTWDPKFFVLCFSLTISERTSLCGQANLYIRGSSRRYIIIFPLQLKNAIVYPAVFID